MVSGTITTSASAHARKPEALRGQESDVLLVRLAQVLVRLLGLLLEQLHPPGQRLVVGACLGALVGDGLGVLHVALELLDLSLEQLVLVGERGNLLLLGQVLLFQALLVRRQLLDLGGGFVGLDAEGVHALGKSSG